MPRLFDSAIFDSAIFDTELRVTVVVFPTLPPTLESVLAGSHTPVARLLFLDADLETVIHEVPAKLIGGSVTMERTRDVHRSATVSVANDDGTYTPLTSSSLVWPNRLVRVERGALVGSTAQYVPLITGIIDLPADAEHEGTVGFSIQGRLELANQQFPAPLTFAIGVRVKDELRSIAELAGLGTTDWFYDLDDGGAARAQPRTYDTRENMLAAMVKLAFDAGCDVWDTGIGVIVLRPFVDPTTSAPLWNFQPGLEGVLISKKRSLRALPGLYNRATAIGTAPDRYPLRAEWRVTNPFDPLYNPPDGSGPVGDRPRPPYISADMTTQQMVNAVAQRLGIEGALGEESTAAAAVPIPILLRDGRPVVAYGDDSQLLDRVTIPVGPGAMSMDSRRVRSLVS